MTRLILAREHEHLLEDETFAERFAVLEKAFESATFSFTPGTVNVVFIEAAFFDFDRKLHVTLACVNETGKTINGLHGLLRMHFNNRSEKISSTQLDFDEAFLGFVENNTAVLVTLEIPVEGLEGDHDFSPSEYGGSFENVRVSYSQDN